MTTVQHDIALATGYVAFTVGSKGSRRGPRYKLRTGLRSVTKRKGVVSCGMPVGAADVALKMNFDSMVAHYSGLQCCGNIWLCPVCAPKVRAVRAEEIKTGLNRLMTDLGGGALFATLTLPHESDDALKRTMELVSDGFRSIHAGRAYQVEKRAMGIVGNIRSFEVTHGRNGWHPHLHTAVCLDRPATPTTAALLEAAWLVRWNRWLAREKWPLALPGIGVKIKVVRTSEDLAAYLAKVQEGKIDAKKTDTDRSVGWELARADMKLARDSGSRVPFQILADFLNTGNVLDLDRWHELEDATNGRSAIRWSPRLKDFLLLKQAGLSDEEIAAAGQEGDVVVLVSYVLWRMIARRPGLDAEMMLAAEHAAAADRDPFDAVRMVVARAGLPTDGLLRPEESADCAVIR